MAMQSGVISYQFWPVGQGLFASGQLEVVASPRPFNWVYDCGTTSNQKYIGAALSEYQGRYFSDEDEKKIDLVTVSHFDKDHISGLVRLLAEFKVGTLLLPYVPLGQRLLIAFEEGLDSQSAEMGFFISPIRYISELPEVQIDEVLYVKAGDGQGPAIFMDEAGPRGPSDQNSDLQIFAERSELTETDWRGEVITESNEVTIKVNFLSGSLKIGKCWEFVPYNDAGVLQRSLPSEFSVFQTHVENARDELLKDPRSSKLDVLKTLYDKQFGDGSEPRNVISLFLYGGPIVSNCNKKYGRLLRKSNIHDDSEIWIHRGWTSQTKDSLRFSILYTGDGYLDTPERFKSIVEYLHIDRLRQVTCFQVMHHGSEANWHDGIAKKLSPDISIFSSDPSTF